MRRARDDPEWVRWWRDAEEGVRALFEKRWLVLPVYAVERGGAPMLISHVQTLRALDLMVANAGQTRFIEVKAKDHPVIWQKTGRFRTGIDLPKWYAYLEVERATGIPGDIAMVHYRAGAADDVANPILAQQSFEHLRYVMQPDPT